MNRKALFTVGMILLAGCEQKDEGPWAGLFGTKAGLTVDQLEKFAVLEKKGGPDENGQYWYESPQAPDMSANADKYIYIVGTKAGLCLVGATFGSLKAENSIVVENLTKKYGRPIKDDSVENGVIWPAEKYKLEEGLKSVRIRFENNSSAQVSAVYLDNDCH